MLVDSNVPLDVATNDPNWSDWSERALAEVAEHTTLIINPIIYAEVSIGYSTFEALDAALPTTLYQREALPWEAAFLAGKCLHYASGDFAPPVRAGTSSDIHSGPVRAREAGRTDVVSYGKLGMDRICLQRGWSRS